MAEDLSSGHDPFLYDTIVDPSHELDNQPGEINTEESNHNEDPESLYAMEADGVNGYTGEAAAIPIQQAGDVQNDHLNASYRVEDHDHDGRGTHNAIVHFHSPLHGNYGERYSSSFYSDFVNESTQETELLPQNPVQRWCHVCQEQILGDAMDYDDHVDGHYGVNDPANFLGQNANAAAQDMNAIDQSREEQMQLDILEETDIALQEALIASANDAKNAEDAKAPATRKTRPKQPASSSGNKSCEFCAEVFAELHKLWNHKMNSHRDEYHFCEFRGCNNVGFGSGWKCLSHPGNEVPAPPAQVRVDLHATRDSSHFAARPSYAGHLSVTNQLANPLPATYWRPRSYRKNGKDYHKNPRHVYHLPNDARIDDNHTSINSDGCIGFHCTKCRQWRPLFEYQHDTNIEAHLPVPGIPFIAYYKSMCRSCREPKPKEPQLKVKKPSKTEEDGGDDGDEDDADDDDDDYDGKDTESAREKTPSTERSTRKPNQRKRKRSPGSDDGYAGKSSKVVKASEAAARLQNLPTSRMGSEAAVPVEDAKDVFGPGDVVMSDDVPTDGAEAGPTDVKMDDDNSEYEDEDASSRDDDSYTSIDTAQKSAVKQPQASSRVQSWDCPPELLDSESLQKPSLAAVQYQLQLVDIGGSLGTKNAAHRDQNYRKSYFYNRLENCCGLSKHEKVAHLQSEKSRYAKAKGKKCSKIKQTYDLPEHIFDSELDDSDACQHSIEDAHFGREGDDSDGEPTYKDTQQLQEPQELKVKKDKASPKKEKVPVTIDEHVFSFQYTSGPCETLPPMVGTRNIIADIREKALSLTAFLRVLEHLNGRALRVGTVCSGTDAPIWFFNLLCDELKRLNKMLCIDHVFSFEIVAFKQQFISRNYECDLIFRNIVEVNNFDEGQALYLTTVYGAIKPVPEDLDVLVAGTACVDYSRLNNHKKDIDDKGESGDTLYSTVELIRRTKPRIVVFENVKSTILIWDSVKVALENVGYTVVYNSVDTKDHYLPQTRERKYLVGIYNEALGKDDNPAEMLGVYQRSLKAMKRPASSSAQDFLLAVDDPMLMEAQQKLVVKDKRANDWEACNVRHNNLRAVLGLGRFARLLTSWCAGTAPRLPDHWLRFAIARVERTLDFKEIAHMRGILRGYDDRFYGRIYNISQGVDRESDKIGHGLSNCLAPSSLMFDTSRGSRLTGYETLLLQGLDPTRLELGGISVKQLHDMAGNAMSVTVVGTVLICLLSAAYKVLTPGPAKIIGSGKPDEFDTQTLEEKVNQNYLVPFEVKVETSGSFTAEDVKRRAELSARLCVCEGELGTKDSTFQRCQVCDHSTCVDCGGNPRHEYNAIETSRTDPVAFLQELEQSLPKEIAIHTICGDMDPQAFLKELCQKNGDTIDRMHWDRCENIMKDALSQSLTFRAVKRKINWQATYESSHAFLVLKIFRDKVEWLLYARVPTDFAVKHPLRLYFAEFPIAKMLPVGGTKLLEGHWQFWLPNRHSIAATITPGGYLRETYRSKLCLKGHLRQYAFSSYNIQIRGSARQYFEGVYDSHEECGQAFDSLHKRVDPSGLNPPLFLFFNHQRAKGDYNEHTYVITDDPTRKAYGEARHCIAAMKPSWQPPVFQQTGELPALTYKSIPPPRGVPSKKTSEWASTRYNTQDLKDELNLRGVLYPKTSTKAKLAALLDESDRTKNVAVGIVDEQVSEDEAESEDEMLEGKLLSEEDLLASMKPRALKITVHGTWVEIIGKLSTVLSHKQIACSRLTSATSDLHGFESCKHDYAVLKARASLSTSLEGYWKEDEWFKIARYTAVDFFDNTLWFLKHSLVIPGHTDGDGFRALDLDDHVCDECAPPVPRSRWRRNDKDNLVPMEDPQDAAIYEKAAAIRPDSLSVIAKISNLSDVEVMISVRPAVLVQRARRLLASSPSGLVAHVAESFRLITNEVAGVQLPMPAFRYTNTKNLEPVLGAITYWSSDSSLQLHGFQAKTVRWLRQMISSPAVFTEEEVVEKRNPHIGYRLEGRVSQDVTVRAAFLAAGVGYGKTVVVLHLIAWLLVNPTPMPAGGLIPTKATFVYVPNHLTDQWQSEAKKFLPTIFNQEGSVLVIRTVKELRSKSVADFQKASIVIISSRLVQDADYTDLISSFAGVVEPSTHNSHRALDAWYSNALKNVDGSAEEMQRHCGGFQSYLNGKLQAANDRANEEEDSVVVPSRRFRGQAYENQKQKVRQKKVVREAFAPDLKRHEYLSNDFHDMKGLPLEAFKPRMVVIDEAIYCVTGFLFLFMKACPGLFKLLLSGTPSCTNFAQFKPVAQLLGLHIGIDDNETIQRSGEMTNTEHFLAYQSPPSNSWIVRRDNKVQEMIDLCFRVDVAEFPDQVDKEEIVIKSYLPLANRIAYLEAEKYFVDTQFDEILGNALSYLCIDDHLLMACRIGPEKAPDARTAMVYVSSDSTIDGGIASPDVAKSIFLKRYFQFYWLGRHYVYYHMYDCLALVSDPNLEKYYEQKENPFLLYNRAMAQQSCDDPIAELNFKHNLAKAMLAHLVHLDAWKGLQLTPSVSMLSKLENLKQKMGQLQATIELLPAAYRSGRLFENASKLTLSQITDDDSRLANDIAEVSSSKGMIDSTQCDACGIQSNNNNLTLLTGCAHLLCKVCDKSNVCAVHNCGKHIRSYQRIERIMPPRSSSFQLLKKSDLQIESNHVQKAIDIVQHIQNGIPANEKVLIFAQHQIQLKQVAAILQRENIEYFELGNQESAAKVLTAFQQETTFRNKGPARVLLMETGEDTANLFVANHVIFFSPFFTQGSSAQAIYDAAMDQAIGRVLRNGQKKPIKVYHFVTAGTIEVDLHEKRRADVPVPDVMSTDRSHPYVANLFFEYDRKVHAQRGV